MLNLKIPPPIIAIICAFLMYFMSLPLFLPFSIFLKVTILFILILLALIFDIQAIVLFHKYKTTILPNKPSASTKLVTSGVYRFSRNPMYVGMVYWLLALAVFLQNLFCLFYVLVFTIYITKFQIKPEEKILLQLFGDEYHNYCQQTPRWLFF